MQNIINEDLDLYLFARWEWHEKWIYLGEVHVLSYEDNVVEADPEGNKTFWMQYQLTSKVIEDDLCEEEIESGTLTLTDCHPKRTVRNKTERKFRVTEKKTIFWKQKETKKLEILEKNALWNTRKSLIDWGKKDLADSIEHVSMTQGDGTEYDIKSFNEDGTDRFIEVKTIKQAIDAEFLISPNEIKFSELSQENYYIYRICNLKFNPLNGFLYINPGNVLDKFDKEPTEFVLKSK